MYEGTYLNTIKIICDKPATDIIPQSQQFFFSEIRNKTRLHTLTTTIQLSTGRMSFKCNADDFEDIHVLIKLTVLNYLYLPKIIPEKNCQVSFYISESFNN